MHANSWLILWLLPLALLLKLGPLPSARGARGRWIAIQCALALATIGLGAWMALEPPRPAATAIAIGYAVLWGLCQTGLAWRQIATLRRRLAAEEIRRLRTQINPHFLYNTLNAISELGYDDPKSADRVITQLGQLLRKALDDSHQQEIALRDEMVFIERYLDIQQVLLRDKLQFAFDIEDRVRSARLPGMIVQPLVENALIHGIGPDGIAHVRIGGRRESDMLVIEVSDDGPGLTASSGTPQAGIGLDNIRARLNHLYGARAGLALHDRDGGGLMARLTIPFHEGFAYDEAAYPDR